MATLPARQFIQSAVTQGLSANRAYRDYTAVRQEAGLRGMRRQDFLRVYSQTIKLRDVAPQAIDAPKGAIPSPELIVARDTIQARGYGQHVALKWAHRDGTGSEEAHWIIKSPTPLTPEEAEQRAIDIATSQEDQYNRRLINVVYTGTEQFNPPE